MGLERSESMALNSSPVSRNLHLKVTILFLELEDLLAIMLAVCGAMLIGNFLFSDRYIFHIPINYFLPLFHARPQQYCAGTQESVIRSSYFREEEVKMPTTWKQHEKSLNEPGLC